MRRGLSRELHKGDLAVLNSPTVERFFSTKWENFCPIPKSRYCGYCRKGNWNASVEDNQSMSTFALSQRRIATWKRGLQMGPSVRTSSIDSMCSLLRCRPSANE